MLDDLDILQYDSQELHLKLSALPASYAGARQVYAEPYSGMAFGEGVLPLLLCSDWIPERLAQTGTQFILSGGQAEDAETFARIIEAREGQVVRLGTAERLDQLTQLIPLDVLSTYAYAQSLAYATDHAADAEEADQLLADLRDRCLPSVLSDQNPAKQLAWSIWTRTPLLIASHDFQMQLAVWQQAIARLGKSMSIPVPHAPLLVLSGGFEARHEVGDERLALLIGSIDNEMQLCREILATRVDEVLEVVPVEAGDYAQNMYLWYLATWVGYYLALAYQTDPADSAPLTTLHSLEPRENLELN